MNKNLEFTKKVFDIIHRLKRTTINSMNDDIRPSEEMLLMNIGIISNDCKIKINDLVESIKFAPSTVSTILKSLEDNGYITREVNKDNKREVFVKITDKGKLRLETAKKRHFDVVSDLINYLGEDDACKLIELLERVTVFFEKKKIERENNNDKVN